MNGNNKLQPHYLREHALNLRAEKKMRGGYHKPMSQVTCYTHKIPNKKANSVWHHVERNNFYEVFKM